jgi:uncharacterized membrane protein
MNKKLKIILTVSIVLNVLLIGAVIGGVSKAHTDRGYKSQRMEQKLAEILNVLPESKSEEFKQRIDNLMQSKRADRKKIRTARKNIMEVFEQEEFDSGRYQQVVKELNFIHQQRMTQRTSLMMEMAEYLSPEERKQLARLMFKRGQRKK